MKLFQQYYTMSPVYKNGYTNHGPMMMEAYRQLGVDETIIKERLNQYYEDKSIGDLENRQYPKSPFEERYISRTNYYMDQIKSTSMTEQITRCINNSMNHYSSALFHGVIRLAYASITNEEILVAQAIAYFDLVHDVSEVPYQEVEMSDWADHIEKLIQIRHNIELSDNNASTMEQYKELMKKEEIRSNITVPSDLQTFDKVIDVLAKRYLNTEDFYSLHTITGCHALLILKDYVDDFDQAMKQLIAEAQGFMILHKYDSYQSHDTPSNSLEDLKKHVSSLKDAHDVKLFYTAYDLYQTYQLESLHQICDHLISKI